MKPINKHPKPWTAIKAALYFWLGVLLCCTIIGIIPGIWYFKKAYSLMTLVEN